MSSFSATLDERGAVRHVLPAEARGTLDADVKLFAGSTPFMVLGNAPLVIAGTTLLCWLAMRRGRRHRDAGA